MPKERKWQHLVSNSKDFKVFSKKADSFSVNAFNVINRGSIDNGAINDLSVPIMFSE